MVEVKDKEKATTIVVVVDWLQLPDDLTVHIMSKLISISDYARFGAVYVKWRSMLLLTTSTTQDQEHDHQHYPKFRFPRQLPLLVIPTHPLQQGKDPVSEYYHLRKAILSADPASNPKDFVVMAVFGGYTVLTLCKPGDEAWTLVKDDIRGLFVDVIYYKDKFYALHYKGSVSVCDVEKKTATTVVGPPVTKFKNYTKYLVESLGELFQVHRTTTDGADYVTVRFIVFKLVSSLESTEKMDADWVEVTDLCDRAFFVGDNASMSISASDVPGCKPNCIYYTDDYHEGYSSYADCGPHDMGVFNLENGSFEKHYPTDVDVQLWPSPIWIEPMPRMITGITRSKQNINII